MPVSVQREDFDPGAEIAAVTAAGKETGAVVSFTGLVRADDGLEEMILEHHPEMAMAALEAIEAEAHARWPLQAVRILHRVGSLRSGERIVLVVTASEHRRDAFAAAEFLMDYLKTRAPFWKKERGPEGEHWVEANATDDRSAARWSQAGEGAERAGAGGFEPPLTDSKSAVLPLDDAPSRPAKIA